MEGVFYFNWRIENFIFCHLSTGEAIHSPVFAADTPYKTHWRLTLYPRGINNPNFVSCYLECHNHNEKWERTIDFWISILDENFSSVVAQRLENVRFQKGMSAGFPELVTWDVLQKSRQHYLPKGTLRIRCYLRAVPPNPTNEALFQLSEVFKKVYLNREFTDILLQSGDNEFLVHRELLCARATTLSKRLSLMDSGSHKPPKYLSKISVGHIPADTLNALLLYLYSGVLETTDFEDWNRLYELAEKNELFDLQRDIFPTPTISSFRTKIHRMTKSIIFPIKNFCASLGCSLSVLVDMDFARVGIEYFVNDLPIDTMRVMLSVFVDDPGAVEHIFCSISALDVDGVSHYTSLREIKYYTSTTCVLPLNIKKEWLMQDLFLSGDTVRLKFKFTVVGEFVPKKMEVMKESKALCLEQKPSYLTLSRLSKDLEQLVNGDTIATINPCHLKHEVSLLQKAILSGWSKVYAGLLRGTYDEKNPSYIPNIETDIGRLVFWFLYTGRIDIPSFKVALSLYSVAQMDELDCLRQISVRNMTSRLSKDTVIGALILADTYNEEELYASSKNFVCSHKDEIFCTDEWKSFSKCYPYILKKVMKHLNNHKLNA